MKQFKLQSFVLVLIAFTLGFSEFLIVGILDDLSEQFNVSVATVGYLVTIFAMVYAVSTPFITLLIGKYNLFWSLLALMGIFIICWLHCSDGEKRLVAVMGIFRLQYRISTWRPLGNLDFNKFWLADFVFNNYRHCCDNNGLNLWFVTT